MPLIVTLFFFALCLVAAWGLGRWFWAVTRKTARALLWRKTTGYVRRCDLVDDNPIVSARRLTHRFDVLVDYVVDGQAYSTGQISAFGDPKELYYRHREIAPMRWRFIVGSPVPVYYNPKDPRDALLLRFEWRGFLGVGLGTLFFAAAAVGILYLGLTVLEPTRLRESKATQALEQQAPVVLDYLKAHPELGRAQRVSGFVEGGPYGNPPTDLTEDWVYSLETTENVYHLRAVDGRIVTVTPYRNPGEPEWFRTLRRGIGL